MIAMAIACNPKLLIADEPTTALDVTIQAQILDLLLGLQRERGMALVLITHDMGVIAETVDRVVVQYAGQQVEAQSVQGLFGDPMHPYTAALLSALPERCAGAPAADHPRCRPRRRSTGRPAACSTRAAPSPPTTAASTSPLSRRSARAGSAATIRCSKASRRAIPGRQPRPHEVPSVQLDVFGQWCCWSCRRGR